MSNTNTLPPPYSQATAFPSAPAVENISYNNPQYPGYQSTGIVGHPEPARDPTPVEAVSYPMQPQTQYPPASYPSTYPPQGPYSAPYPPPQPQTFPGGPSQTGYNQTAAEAGGYGARKYEDDDPMVIGNTEHAGTEWVGNSFSEKAIRHAFIKKVYLILMSQLTVTIAFVCFFLFYAPVKKWVGKNHWFYWCAYGVFIVTYITLVCCDSVRRRWPGNFICLGIFTLAFSYMTGTIASYYNTESVLIALGITAAVCLAISLFAIQTKIDFTMCFGLMFALSMTLIFFGFACLIVYLITGPNLILQCVYGGVAALIFSMFLVFDTQMIVGGKKRKYQLSAEEHIYGALQLYLDIVNLFLIMLSLVGSGRSN